MNELLAIMMSWAVTLTGYSFPATAPEITFAPHSYLVAHACGGRECKVMGWFPPGKEIFLDNRLNPSANLYASSILLHELVHYLQYQSGKQNVSCQAAMEMEREAYAAQQQYLVRYGVYQPVGVGMHAAGCETESELATHGAPCP